jgi:hypothetical protein
MTSRRLRIACILGVMALAIGLRVAHASRHPDRIHGDGKTYHRLAQRLLTEGELGYGADGLRSFRPPLYPTWLAGVYAALGARPFHARVAECAVSGLIALLIALIGRRLGLPWAGVLGALIYALNGYGIRRDATLYSENLTALLLAALVLTSLAPWALGAWPSVGRGVLGGLLSLLQPGLVVVPLAIAGHTALAGRTWRHVVSAGLLVLGLVAALVPWTVRNQLLHGRLVFITTNGGYNLLRGNNPHATGDKLSPEGVAYAESVLASAPSELTELELDRWCRDRALAWMADNPRLAIRNALLRVRHWWLPGSLADPGSRWPVTYGAIFPLALIGLVAIVRRRLLCSPIWVSIVAASVPSALIVYAGARYRAPVLPLICLLAGAGALALVALVRRLVRSSGAR